MRTPHGIAAIVVSEDEQLLLISAVDHGSVTFINRRDAAVRHVPTGAAPEGSALDPSGRELWMLNAGANTVSVVDVQDAKVVATFDSAGRFPIRVQFDVPRGQAWITNNASRSLAVFDIRSRRLLASLPVDESFLGCRFLPAALLVTQRCRATGKWRSRSRASQDRPPDRGRSGGRRARVAWSAVRERRTGVPEAERSR